MGKSLGRERNFEEILKMQGQYVSDHTLGTPETRREIARQVTEMMDLGIVTESSSPWSAPTVLVTKHDGSKRLCIDYRALNALTLNQQGSFLSSFDDVTLALAESQPNIFSTLDLKSGYYVIPLKEEDREKTAFDVPSIGRVEFKVLPFGLSGAPFTFSQAMSRVLRGINFKHYIAYLDDTIVFSRGIKDHIENLREVFQRFRENNFMLHGGKCTWALEKVRFLGHVISGKGLECEPAKVETVKNFPRPHNVKTTRSFLGLASYFRKFIRNFAGHAAPSMTF